MPATGPDFARRLFLVAPFAAGLLADAGRQIFELFTALASALSEGNAVAFLQSVDRSMPDYEQLRANVTALTEQCDVLSSIEVLADEGDDKRRTVELDWFLELREKLETGLLERRREQLKCRLERKARKWKIVSLAPVRFFAPIRPQASLAGSPRPCLRG